MNTRSPYELEVGVDVAKNTLQVQINDLNLEFKNDIKGIASLVKKALAVSKSCRFTCESTGGYEDGLISYLLEKNLPISQVNATFIKNFIKSYGKLAKTDQIDAKFISLYSQERNPDTLDETWLRVKDRRELQHFIDHLVGMNKQHKCNMDKFSDERIRTKLQEMIQLNKQTIKEHRKIMEELIVADRQLKKIKDVLESVTGVGSVTSMVIINTIPELGTLNRREIAALVGVAPMHQDSGKYQGMRKICAGRARPRTALYLATIVGIRHNEVIRSYYKGLRFRGKKARVAIIAAVRKLLTHLNSLVKKEIYGI